MELLGNTTRENLALAERNGNLANEILQGLSASPKRIPAKFHYDEIGSALFEKITEQPEYYLTASEREILCRHGAEILALASSPSLDVVELGPGSGMKAVDLIRTAGPLGEMADYFAVDVSLAAIDMTRRNFARHLPLVRYRSVISDYSDSLTLPPSERQRLVLFLGSSIGNFSREAQQNFFSQVGSELKKNDLLMTGFDLVKDEAVLNAAYNDARGVTEEFNFNLLSRLNRDVGANFQRQKFERQSFFDGHTQAVETFLISKSDQTIRLDSLASSIALAKGESIHIESSCKFTLARIEELAFRSGFEVVAHFHDTAGYFTDSVWRMR